MCVHNKPLQDTVRVAVPDPGLAYLLLEQVSGPRGEFAAACGYFAQAVKDDPSRKDMLSDIATEELGHFEIIGPIVAVQSKGGRGQSAEAVESEAELYRSLSGSNDSAHDSAAPRRWTDLDELNGIPLFTSGSFINMTAVPGIKESLDSLMTRARATKVVRQALHRTRPHFPHGKPSRVPEFPAASTTTCHRKRTCADLRTKAATDSYWRQK
jgi:Mn-containing catalase